MKTEVTERANGTRRVVQAVRGESRTEQAHRQETNINTIVSRYQRTGLLPVAAGSPRYGDFTGVVDYHSAVDAVHAAEDAFLSLPADVRKRFRNDPGELLAFLEDEGNRAEAVALGLIVPPEPDLPPEGPSEAPESPVEG